MKVLIVLLLLVVYTNAFGIIGRTQSAAVKGILMCNNKPASNVKVKLYDDDRVGMDELLAQGKTDSQGFFQLQGSTKEITTIDPKVNVYHDCEDEFKPCQRKITIYIPDAYISSGKNPKRIYDAGTIQLAGKFKGETRDCIN
ncbi:unnamed protein product [Thelazia callipaeda]|uniref:Transthyretin-like family protein n=1 Tax=Thelazia callipaeda TaxID=103827 RepID=A0A0N5D534_THECL|nr:unnamed protein product [Thelazia callipaeda]